MFSQLACSHLLGVLTVVAPGGQPAAGNGGRISQPQPAAELFSVPGPIYHWQDFDLDGARDVYVQSASRDQLLRNEQGRFVDVTEAAGLAGRSGTQWVAWVDLDNDQLPDLTLIDAQGRLRLLRNAAVDFVDMTEPSGLPTGEALSLVEWQDLNGDGLLDAHIVTGSQDLLFKNLGGGRFDGGNPLNGPLTMMAGPSGLSFSSSKLVPGPGVRRERARLGQPRELRRGLEQSQPRQALSALLQVQRHPGG